MNIADLLPSYYMVLNKSLLKEKLLSSHKVWLTLKYG